MFLTYCSILILSSYSVYFIQFAYFTHEYLRFKSLQFFSNICLPLRVIFFSSSFSYRIFPSIFILLFSSISHSNYFPFWVFILQITFQKRFHLKYILLRSFSLSLIVIPYSEHFLVPNNSLTINFSTNNSISNIFFSGVFFLRKYLSSSDYLQ